MKSLNRSAYFFLLFFALGSWNCLFAGENEKTVPTNGNETSQISAIENPVALELLHHVEECDRNDLFERSRSIDDYRVSLGVAFSQALDQLTGSDHWLDSGAGTGTAVGDYFGDRFSTPFYFLTKETAFRKANVTLVTLDHTQYDEELRFMNVWYDNLYAYNKDWHPLVTTGKVQILSGRTIESIPNDELLSQFGQARLITDVFGAIAYSPYPHQVLQKYYDLMTDDGQVFIKTQTVVDLSISSLLTHKVIIGDRAVSFVDWIKSLPNFKVTQYKLDKKRYQKKENYQEAMRLTKIPGQKPIPELRLESVLDEEEPRPRIFRLDSF